MRSPFILVLLFACMTAPLAAKGNSKLEDSEIDIRLSFLESKLSDIKTPSTYWHYGWTGFYGVSATSQLYQAIDEDDSDESTKQWVGAIKSAGGFAMMILKPLPVVAGWNEYQTLPANTRAEKLAKLVEAEKILKQSAWRADERYTMKPHWITIGANLLGAAVIATFGDSDDALGSAVLGIAMGEAAIWSQPYQPRAHWDSYQQHFNHARKHAYNWRVIPGINSISLEITF